MLSVHVSEHVSPLIYFTFFSNSLKFGVNYYIFITTNIKEFMVKTGIQTKLYYVNNNHFLLLDNYIKYLIIILKMSN
jgi:hypothetical protein